MKTLLPLLLFLVVTAQAQSLKNDTLAVRAILDSNGYYTTPANMVIYSEKDYGLNRVTGLNFSSLTPLKYLPLEIKQLDQLRELAVAFDSSAIFSSEIGKLSKLQQLQVTGKLHSVPPEIFNLPDLFSLDLADNLIDSLPDNIGNAKKLRGLNLCGNRLRHLPAGIGEMISLRNLDLHNNNISVLPTGIGMLDSLNILYLSNNNFSVFPDEICDIKNLTDLKFSHNQLQNVPSKIAKLRNLIGLDLNNNKLTNIPNSIDSLFQLRRLDLSFNQLTELPLSFIKLNLIPGASCGSTGCHPFEVLQIGSNRLCSLSVELSRFLSQCDADWMLTQECQNSIKKKNIDSDLHSIRSSSSGQAYDLFGRQIKTDNLKYVNSSRIVIIQNGKNTKKFLIDIH